VLVFIQSKLDDGLKPATIRNSLSILRRVVNLLVRDDMMDRNPISNLGERMRRVVTASATETDL
jgi:site-specific recombinase XerC